ncbi:oligosaccharide flippase family protein [Bosea lathyri]|uniref:Membrane protein involved in the export of O-antigen and teichoic acid n=1 Tax=Bosea lathyri TaxID=1036778 RepID=A0A1H6BH90_9HYPH|nr:oligosaccharide flippase family protein [Bosea lathyri]SEG59962.1 Membrane protein involved in the export of O-antigen and teichoic acid [Bosea lathyri]
MPLLSGMSMAYSQLATAVFGVFLASRLGAEDYGTVSLARNFFMIAVVLSPLGLDLALQRHLARASEASRANEVAWLRLAAFTVSATVTALLFTDLARLLEAHVFQHAGFGLVLAFTMAALPLATDMAVLGGAYRGIYRPLLSVVTTYFIQPTIRIVAILILLSFISGLWAVVIGTLISFILAWALQAARAHSLFPVGAGFLGARHEAAKVMRYALVLGVSTFIFTVARSLDTISLGYWATLADVGRYAIVQMVGQLVAMIGIALGQTLASSVAAAARDGDTALMATILKNNMSLASILCAPLCVAIAIWGRDIDLLLGPTYQITGSVFIVAALTQWLMTVTHYSSVALSMTGRHMTELFNNLLALAVQLLACALLVPYLGMLGAALATLSTILILTVIRQIQIIRVVGILLVDWKLLYPLLISAVVAAPFAYFGSMVAWRAWWLTGAVAGAHVTVSFIAVFLLVATTTQKRDLLARVRRRA